MKATVLGFIVLLFLWKLSDRASMLVQRPAINLNQFNLN